MITHFRGTDYGFLSNFAPAEIEYRGEIYPSVEHAFQAVKTLKINQRKAIQAAATPGEAKRIGRRVTMRADWEEVKLVKMEFLLRQKFAIPSYRQRLLNTGNRELIEGNTWGDKFWGCVQTNGRWDGQNNLGKLLMKIRAELCPQYPLDVPWHEDAPWHEGEAMDALPDCPF